MEQIAIKLEETDDITSIRSRVEFALLPPTPGTMPATGNGRPTRLLLLVPRKNKALQSLVHMKLLARTAKTRAIKMALVSDQPTVRDYAREAGIKAFGSVRSAKWAGWATSETPVAIPEETLPPVVPVPLEEGNGQVKRVKNKKYRVIQGRGRVNIWQQLGALILLAILALALVVGVFTLLPQATVTLVPVARPLETNLVVKGDPTVKTVDFKTLTFPARTAQVELALPGEIETTQTELAPVGQAQGTVTFINRTDQSQFIPMSTTLTTSAGEPVQFVTSYTITIPSGAGATSTPTLVFAVKPGPKGNVGAGQINRFENASFGVLARVINEQSLTGGKMEPAKIVVQDDKERLQAYLQQKIQQEGLNQLQASLGEQEFISPETLQVIVMDVKYREFAGDFSDTFGGEMQAVVRGTVVGGYNANRLALAALEAQVPPGYELNTKGLHFGAGEVLDVQNQTVTFRIIAAGLATPIIDQHAVADEVAWLPIGEAQDLLSQHYNLATVPGVELKPDWFVEWLGRLPYSPFRINVVIKEAVTLVAANDWAGMRLMALDIGERRIGIAISESGILATPHSVLQRKSKQEDFVRLKRLLEMLKIERVIVGLPYSLSGPEQIGPQARRVKRYAEALAATLSIPIEYFDESYSTVDAAMYLSTYGQRNIAIDAAAAAVILQNYLDSFKNNSAWEVRRTLTLGLLATPAQKSALHLTVTGPVPKMDAEHG